MTENSTSEMNTITRRFNSAHDTAVVSAKLRDLAMRASKKGISTDLTWNVEQEEVDGQPSFVLTVEFSDLVRLAGGWRLVAVADATSTDEPLVFTFDDNTTIDSNIDMKRCDHCGRRTQRNKVIFVTNDAGKTLQVGGSCSKDFLGHDPFWMTFLIEAVDTSEFESYGGTPDYDTDVVVSAAISATRLGYRRTCDPMSTKQVIEAMLSGSFYNSKRWADEYRKLTNSPEATVTSRQVLDWMLEQDGEFGNNLRRIAESKTCGSKAFGLVAYAPTGLMKQEREAQAKEIEEQNKPERTEVPVTSDRIEITGTVTRLYERVSDYGVQYKMIVLDDRGFEVCGTQPSSLDEIEVGERVTFIAKVSVSDRDNTFGFFNRPTKATAVA